MLRHEESVETVLQRIAEKAGREPKFQFTSLFHLMNEELLLGCYERLRKNAAAGIDEVTKAEYSVHLTENLQDLVRRLHRMSYRPRAVRRVYIPKVGSDKLRPLGIPALEDKLVQAGLVRILQAVYEQDFIGDSYGFRPGRGCHDALRALSLTVERKPVNWIVEADIRGFFDNVDQNHLMAFVGHRIGDKRVQRMIRRFLRAGIQEDGAWRASERGTPQGGVISPLLANIYLHYCLDLWYERRFRKTCEGGSRLIRYADDFVVCFAVEGDALRFRKELEERLGQFGLEVAPEKTQVLAFGAKAQREAKARGEKLKTFNFLGFTHYASRSHKSGKFRMKRRTISKRFTVKLRAYKDWLKANRTLSTPEIMLLTAAKLRGHCAYYGVTDNGRSVQAFFNEVKRTLFNWLGRRGKRKSYSWEKFQMLLKRYPLPTPRVMVSLF
jgi:RNA-directed DNA polymerase